jgi:hypothetical protein
MGTPQQYMSVTLQSQPFVQVTFTPQALHSMTSPFFIAMFSTSESDAPPT